MKEPPILKMEVKPAPKSGWCPGCGGLMVENKMHDGRVQLICLECGRKEYKG